MAENDPDETGAAEESMADEAYCSACNASYAGTVETCPRDGERLIRFHARPDTMLGRVIDERFEVRGRLGRGGMGTVYRAWQRSVDREVAIKVVDQRLSHDRTAAKRFLREARLASRLSQPSIVNVYDFGQTEDGILYLVMELLRGRTLAQVIAMNGPMTVRRAIGIAVQLCDALDAAHGQEIIHRDLKPQNVVVLDDPPGRDLIKVLDFGLAKSLVRGDGTTVTESDAMLGTPLYMAPESIEGKPADRRVDLYALGCMIHELIGGRPPFNGESRNLVLAMHLSATPPALPQSVPAEIVALVEELLSKNPAERPESAAAVRGRLLTALELGAELDSRPSPRRTTAPTRASETQASSGVDVPPVTVTSATTSRSRWPLAIGALVALLPIAAGAWWLAEGPRQVGPGDREPELLILPVIDAGVADAAPPPDAALEPADAAAAIDAAPPPDAAPRKKKPPRPTTPSASSAEPDIDFVMPKPKSTP